MGWEHQRPWGQSHWRSITWGEHGEDRAWGSGVEEPEKGQPEGKEENRERGGGKESRAGRAHGICNQELVSTLLYPFTFSSRVEKNEGGRSLRTETNAWLPLRDHWKSGGDKVSLIQGGFREEASSLCTPGRWGEVRLASGR